MSPETRRQDAPVAQLKMSGRTDHSGDVRGKGTLTLFLSDAAEARIALDYRADNRLRIAVDSEAGIRLSADDTLTLGGGLERDLLRNETNAFVRAELELAKDLTAELEQEFGTDGPTTSIALKLRFT